MSKIYHYNLNESYEQKSIRIMITERMFSKLQVFLNYQKMKSN